MYKIFYNSNISSFINLDEAIDYMYSIAQINYRASIINFINIHGWYSIGSTELCVIVDMSRSIELLDGFIEEDILANVVEYIKRYHNITEILNV